MNERQFDAEVDDTVRRMLAVPPAADLRARVLARIEKRPPRLTWARAAWATAAAALVMAALLRDAPAPPPVIVPAGGETESAANSASSRLPVPGGTPRADVPRGERRVSMPLPPTPDDLPPIEIREIVVAPPDAPEEIEPTEIVIAPLAEPADITMEPLPFPPGARE